MDVTLVLTHRCNLACGYCYAGEHHKTDMDDAMLARAVELLFADGAPKVQLSFFGGEPFLAFEAMRRATALARKRAAEEKRELVLQCTTNGTLLDEERVRFLRDEGVRVTVSVDGIQDAHDVTRPCAGGRSSFDQVMRGLHRLRDAGVPLDAMMVITPKTAQYAYLSVSFLWGEGVRVVRGNLALDEPWTKEDRTELREQLVSIGWELLARKLRGEPGTFQPFERAMAGGRASAKRNAVVVATSGRIYPCAPMVGEDRIGGPESGVCIGHIDDGARAIALAVERDGVRCANGSCACAAYLETGDRNTAGPIGQWYGAVCAQIGASIAEQLEKKPVRARKRSRRPLLIGIAAVIGAATAAPLAFGLLAGDERPLAPCELRRVGPGHPDVTVDGEMPAPPGQVLAPPPPPPPPPEEPEPHEVMMRGELSY
jgi:uncharacterized protein